jgi:hypothetical protein
MSKAIRAKFLGVAPFAVEIPSNVVVLDPVNMVKLL